MFRRSARRLPTTFKLFKVLNSGTTTESSTCEKQFILEDEQPGKNVNPQQHRAEIMKLPEIARQQREANERLTDSSRGHR